MAKKKVKYPLIYRLDSDSVIVWLSPTKCFLIKQLSLF